MKNNIDSPNSELKFVNFSEFKNNIKFLKILCTNNNVSGNIFNKLFNIDSNISQGKKNIPSDSVLREILSETCPQQISLVNKLFNIEIDNYSDTCDANDKQLNPNPPAVKRGRKKKDDIGCIAISDNSNETQENKDKEVNPNEVPKKRRKKDVSARDQLKVGESSLDNSTINDLYEYIDLIFKCTSANIISKKDLDLNKYYKINEWIENSDIGIPYTYFNTKHASSRVSVNETKKNVITLKIKNEDLKEDLLAINILLKFTSADKSDYLLHVKAYVVNDPYETIRSEPVFVKYFGKHKYLSNGSPFKLYNKIHIRDCCLNSFNGLNSMDYIDKVYNAISNCNVLCTTEGSVRSKNGLESNLGVSSDVSLSHDSKNSKHKDIVNPDIKIDDDLPWLKEGRINNTNTLRCVESPHFIQKFAKYCFHTKYLIMVHTSEFSVQSCLFLAVILVRCNNRLCREFLDTLPNLIKQTIMQNAGIGSVDESKTDANVSEKITLSQRINIWKQLFSLKYGVNVKKLIDKCNELCSDEDGKGSLFGDGNAEKERVKKMISYLEKISINFFLLNIHSQLIDLVDNAKLMYPSKKINSLQDVLIAMVSDESKCIGSDLFSGNLSDRVKLYLKNFAQFEITVRERILNMSEGQLTVKKAIWQYIMDIVCNANPLATRKILCLIGPPGVGKTFIAMCIAKILFFEPDKNPTDDEVKNLVYILSIPSLTGENTLLGSNAVYVGAQPGILTKEVLFVQSLFRKLIVLDEIDKPCKYIEQLLSVIDYTQNSKIVDNYFEIEVDVRTVVLIATANDASKINPILKDRMQIINVSGYSTYTKASMVQKQMLTVLLKERGLAPDLITIPLPVLENLILTRTKEAGVRKLKNLILEIINTVNLAIVTNISSLANKINEYNDNTYISDYDALECKFFPDNKYYHYSHNNIEELYIRITNRYMAYLNSISNSPTKQKNNIILTKLDIDIMLADKFKLKNDHIRDIVKWEPGKIIGLYATTMGIGGILPITIKFNKSLSKKGMLITLGAQKTMQDSAMISTILTSDYIMKLDENIFNNYFGITQHDFNERIINVVNNSAIHIILDSSVQKDGPSAGGAFMISHLSKLLGHTLSNRVGLTGEISSNFKITAIGGINMKVNGAIDAGCRSVIAPTQNITDILREIVSENSIDVKNEFGKRCAFIYYSDVDECYTLLVRTKPTNTTKDDLSSFDVNIEYGIPEYLTDFCIDVPSIYKIKFSHLNKHSDLLNHINGLNIKLINNITLKDIMKSHFLILALENIYEIYYFMVLAKHVYNSNSDLSEDYFYKYNNHSSDLVKIDEPNDVVFDGNKISCSSNNSSLYNIKEKSTDKDKMNDDDDPSNDSE